ncbi:unnamed protein product [Ranitomeya imitator]|uniref:Helix-turn-helix domain-containing protein n=1 Tax=Ranitomeya imitator TaxID=111125 RepID=A0ABN9L2Y4_9NEOB|nr:unnamed protein product [Ranitomeya imitator]
MDLMALAKKSTDCERIRHIGGERWERHIFQGDGAHAADPVVGWFRYIDDVLMIWNGGETSLSKFMQELNHNTFNLKFTYSWHKTKIDFLDITVCVAEDGSIETDLFRKETSVNSLLHASSAHNYSVIKAIPVGQFLRNRRVCSTEARFERQSAILSERFRARGYSRRSIRAGYGRAKSTRRGDLLRQGTKSKMDDGSGVCWFPVSVVVRSSVLEASPEGIPKARISSNTGPNRYSPLHGIVHSLALAWASPFQVLSHKARRAAFERPADLAASFKESTDASAKYATPSRICEREFSILSLGTLDFSCSSSWDIHTMTDLAVHVLEMAGLNAPADDSHVFLKNMSAFLSDGSFRRPTSSSGKAPALDVEATAASTFGTFIHSARPLSSKGYLLLADDGRKPLSCLSHSRFIRDLTVSTTGNALRLLWHKPANIMSCADLGSLLSATPMVARTPLTNISMLSTEKQGLPSSSEKDGDEEQEHSPSCRDRLDPGDKSLPDLSWRLPLRE